MWESSELLTVQVRILIVDDHDFIRRGVRALLSSRQDWIVCAEAADGLEAIERAKQFRPDVILMDLSMPRMDGIQATRIIQREVPGSAIIVVSQNDPAVVRRQTAGIETSGFVAKSDLARDLVPAIENAVRARTAQPPHGGKTLPVVLGDSWFGDATLQRTVSWT